MRAEILLLGAALAWAQPQPDPRNCNIHFQATSVGESHGGFPSPYSGENSLQPRTEEVVSLTTTAFVGLRVAGSELYFNPEVSGGKGFSGVVGIAGFPNGEITRVASSTPKPYIARLYVRHSWGIGSATQFVEDGANQLGAERRSTRLTLIAGKLAATDFFDGNRYSHDPRTQFLNWSLMSNGAWDYPADTRGYTVGAVQELSTPSWSLRAGTFLMPRYANGMDLDAQWTRNHGEAVEWEQRYGSRGSAGKLRILSFANRAHSGTYRQALRAPGMAPDILSTRRAGTLKYGFGLNLEQSLTADAGLFARYGWNDGKTESWAFTQIDRTGSLGVSLAGRRWRRPHDVLGIAGVQNAISGDHRAFLAAGGLGFIVGDGRLNPGRESITEAYYAWQISRMFTLTGDYQHVWNPGYNRDRGPVSILGIRLHWEL